MFVVSEPTYRYKELVVVGAELATETKIMVALELLGGDFSDTVIRAFAVSYLSLVPDATVARYLQQIVQVRIYLHVL